MRSNSNGIPILVILIFLQFHYSGPFPRRMARNRFSYWNIVCCGAAQRKQKHDEHILRY